MHFSLLKWAEVGYLVVWNGMKTTQHMPHMTGTVMCLWHSPNRWLKSAQQKESVLFLPQSSPACALLSWWVHGGTETASPLNIAPISSLAFLTGTRNTLDEKGTFQGKSIFQFFVWQEKRKNVTFGSDGTDFFSPWEKSLKSQDLAQLLKLEPL